MHTRATRMGVTVMTVAALTIPATGHAFAALTAPAEAAEAVMPYAFEDGAYPNAAQIEADKGIKLIRGDGNIVLAECDLDTEQIRVHVVGPPVNMQDTYCFDSRAATGRLTLDLNRAFWIDAADQPMSATLAGEDGTTKTITIAKDGYTPVGEGVQGGVRSRLVELRVTGPSGAAPAPSGESSHPFAARLEIGEGDSYRSCSAALVDPQWVLTAASCFTRGSTQLAPGKPAEKTVATIGRADLNTSGGHVAEVVDLAPRNGRDLVMARLATPATGVTPVAIASTPVVQGDTLTVPGYGRTKTAWSPLKLHTSTFTAGAVTANEVNLTGGTAVDLICKGTAGAPLLRVTDGKPELVGVNSRSWQGSCLGTDPAETRGEAIAARADGAVLGSRLTAGQRLLPGETLASASAKLTMRPDGNLVITSNAGKTLWSTGTTGTGATALLDATGNLVVRNAADTANLWEAKTTAAGGAAVLTDRGSLTVHTAQGVSQWSSGTVVRNDFNGDGYADMSNWYVYADGTDAMHLFEGTTDGSIAAPHSSMARTATDQWDLADMKKVSGDFNGDGIADVAVMNRYDSETKLWTFLGKTNGAFEAPFATWTGPVASWQWERAVLHSGDANGDGRDDVIAWYEYSDTSDALFTFVANPQGGFGTPVKSWTSTTWTRAMGKTVTGDYNGDGRDDIAVFYDYAGGAIKVWTFLAQANGGYAAPFAGFVHDGWGDWAATNVHSGDFDADGRDDLLFWFDHPDGRDIAYVLKSNANGTFVAPRAALTIAAGSMTYSSMKTVVGDYNGDGRDDIGAMYGYTNGTVKMLTWLTKPDATFDPVKVSWSTTTAGAWSYASTHFINRHNG
ncbi:FG-GAP-like repeat-containing protein [Streptomyces roseofulvus]|uniref:FG-GAP-like repeat-containing protein n=1 Tax=Streptomyces roseofulvus TaxID=33902 RepID=UPI0031F877C5